MRFILHATTLCILLAAQAVATGSGLFTANGVELQEYRFGEEIMYGEPQRLVQTRDTQKCTKCVGHHGHCVIGEGNCYPPDTCAFCGGCTVNQARCQDPQKEGCVCYGG